MKKNRRRFGCQPVKFSTISHNNMQACLYAAEFTATAIALRVEFEAALSMIKWHLASF